MRLAKASTGARLDKGVQARRRAAERVEPLKVVSREIEENQWDGTSPIDYRIAIHAVAVGSGFNEDFRFHIDSSFSSFLSVASVTSVAKVLFSILSICTTDGDAPNQDHSKHLPDSTQATHSVE